MTGEKSKLENGMHGINGTTKTTLIKCGQKTGTIQDF